MRFARSVMLRSLRLLWLTCDFRVCLRMKSRFSRAIVDLTLVIITLLFLGAPLRSAESADGARPVLLYSRHFNAVGETRYLPDGTYKEVLSRLRAEFEVRVHNHPLTTQTLMNVSVVLIANPSDKAVGANPPPPHVSTADIEVLTRFVERGGCLIVMGNQENHNLEIEDMNKLLARFGLQFTNLYTDVKKLVLPEKDSLLGGLRWGYYTGNLVQVAPAH